MLLFAVKCEMLPAPVTVQELYDDEIFVSIACKQSLNLWTEIV